MDGGKKVLLWLLVIAAIIFVVLKVDNKIIYWALGFLAFLYSVFVVKNLIKNTDIDWD